MSKTTNKFSPEVRSRAVRLVLEHEHPSRWATIRKHPAWTAGGSGHAASLAAFGFQFQGRS
jgi:hypothetical protein